MKFRLLQQIEVSSGISKLCYKGTHGRRSEDVLHRSSSWTLHIKAKLTTTITTITITITITTTTTMASTVIFQVRAKKGSL